MLCHLRAALGSDPRPDDACRHCGEQTVPGANTCRGCLGGE